MDWGRNLKVRHFINLLLSLVSTEPVCVFSACPQGLTFIQGCVDSWSLLQSPLSMHSALSMITAFQVFRDVLEHSQAHYGCLVSWMSLSNIWLSFQSIACPNQYHNLRITVAPTSPTHLIMQFLLFPMISEGMGFFSMLHFKSSQCLLPKKVIVFHSLPCLVDLLY